MLRSFILGILTLAVCATPASAVTITRVDGVTPIPRYQAWVDTSPTPKAPGIVRIQFGATQTHYVPEGRIIYVASDAAMQPWMLMHELGHDYERIVLSQNGWNLWASWFAVPYGRDYYDGNRYLMIEWFADSYEACSTGGATLRVVAPNVFETIQGLRAYAATWQAACKYFDRFR